MLRRIKKLIPRPLFRFLQPIYHYTFALVGALVYRMPSRHIHVVGITGTKGKTTVSELVNAILEEAGYTTALAGTLRFKIGNTTTPNTFKMTMLGRIFLQRFIRQAVNADCDYVILEMTSEGAKQFRHRFIDLNALIFTNLSPEHIESHGSFEKYKEAKRSIALQVERTHKADGILVINADDENADTFLSVDVPHKKTFALSHTPIRDTETPGMVIEWGTTELTTSLSGRFNAANILAAATYAHTQNVSTETIRTAIQNTAGIRGRVEYINEGQACTVIVDYAHTPDSLRHVYETFSDYDIIGVLGNTGGGRDTWKRPEMGSIADQFCSYIILTNEDPYDEDPERIVKEMKTGITSTPVEIIMDRRHAIRTALQLAHERHNTDQTAVLITGKGTDPYIMGPEGSKEPWNDAEITREELRTYITSAR